MAPPLSSCHGGKQGDSGAPTGLVAATATNKWGVHIKIDDGAERAVGPGDAFVCDAGHDAWIVGSEPCAVIDFTAPQYAKPSKG